MLTKEIQRINDSCVWDTNEKESKNDVMDVKNWLWLPTEIIAILKTRFQHIGMSV